MVWVAEKDGKIIQTSENLEDLIKWCHERKIVATIRREFDIEKK